MARRNTAASATSRRPTAVRPELLAESYRRLAEVYHEVLSEQALDALLERIADTLADLVPYEALHVYEADEARRLLVPVLARSDWAEEIMRSTPAYGQGITGWAVEHREPVLTNAAHLDPRVAIVPGTPADPEALISIPLVARGAVKGALNVYRIGDSARFDEHEFELAKWFGDAAALALDNAQIRARLEHQAQTDPLTGLYNHRLFHERLRGELNRASRAHDTVTLLMFDLDDFKRVNDVHGHAAGDRVLVGLASLVQRTVRNADVVCRIGGEEFAVIMPSCDVSGAVRLAERITERLGEAELEPEGRVTVSIGVAEGPAHAMNPRELVACAEVAMMTAKAGGKNRVAVFDGPDAERPAVDRSEPGRDSRSIAHLKMLQSLAGRLNRLTSLSEIGDAIALELRQLIDYHNCRVFLVEGQWLEPVAFLGDMSVAAGRIAEVLRLRIGEGITGRVAETGESLLVPDARHCEYAVRVPGTEEIDESLIAVPLPYGSRVTGAIVISKLGLDQFDEADLRLLEVLAGHAAAALENARLYETQRREAENAKALLEFSRELAGVEGMEIVLSRIVELTAHVFGSQRASLWLQDALGGPLRAHAWWGYSPEFAAHVAQAAYGPEIWSAWVEAGGPFEVGPEELSTIEDVYPDARSERYAIAPVTFEDGRIGCLAVSNEDEGEFGERRLRLLEDLALQARIAIKSAQSVESLERTFVSTVEALATALEASDEYTSTHARWITDLALRTGAELALDTRALKRLELGSLFHDIGKIGIPEAILQKPGPLTLEERTIVEQHPVLGERILAPIDQLVDVRPIVRACHERWDGHGYPDGLAGEEIPLEARIILVCDAFHAMTSDRPYRRRLPAEVALERLRDAAGTQLDPGVVDVFLRVLAAGEGSAPTP
jgi:diguanylate cyclase (GGDEF)-like protein